MAKFRAAPMTMISLDELKQRHGGTWGNHPSFPVEDWTTEVSSGDTRRGYWEWVAAKIEEQKTR